MRRLTDFPLKRSTRSRSGSAFTVVLVMLVLVLSGIVFYQVIADWRGDDIVSPRGDLADSEKTQIKIFNLASPSVVHITSLTTWNSDTVDDPVTVPRGSGSGMVWDKKGHIVTNFHVIAGANQWKVTLHDKSIWNATLVGQAPHGDLAVLKIDAPKSALKNILKGRSSNLQVGQNVFAIGNPYGLDGTYSTGVISGLERTIESLTRHKIYNVIQTDAAINPGNSGGPLLDSAGLLIGVNTAIVSPSGASAGIGFAVPVDEVRRIVKELIETGKVERPGLGVKFFSDAQMNRWLTLKAVPRAGVVIDKVLKNGAAAKAHLQPTSRRNGRIMALGDLIVRIGKADIQSSRDLFDIIDKHKIGDTVSVTVLRDESEKTLQLQLKALPSTP